MTLSLTINETLKWLSSLPILMQQSFWWWQCSDRYIISLFPPSIPPPFSPSLISLVVFVDVKHHVYFLTLPTTSMMWCRCYGEWVGFCHRITAVARKRSPSFCQKCRWQVTAKHAYTLRMWLCMKWHGAWLYGVHRTYTERAAVSCGTGHASAVSTPFRWVFRNEL